MCGTADDGGNVIMFMEIVTPDPCADLASAYEGLTADDRRRIETCSRSRRNVVLVARARGTNLGIIALEERSWDTRFFARLMGLIPVWAGRDPQVLAALLREVDTRAAALGYRHVMVRIDPQDTGSRQCLEDERYRLIDVGTTVRIESVRSVDAVTRVERGNVSIRRLDAEDRDAVVEFGTTLFPRSYFYRDPFFSRGDADALHRQWILNCFAGQADAIWGAVVDNRPVGFLTCGLDNETRVGSIGLFAVHPDFRGRGIGTLVLRAALAWFFESGAQRVKVKTQSFNYPALNLYLRNGFLMDSADLTYARRFP